MAGFAACSNFVLERERSRLGLGAARFRVIYNGVEVEAFASLWDHGRRRQQVRRQYGMEDEPTVLFAGKLRESKGVHILLRAMTRVWEVAPRAALVLVGGTEYGRTAPCGRPRLWASCAGTWPGPRAGWCSPGLFPRLTCPGPISWGTSSWARPRSRRASGWFFWKRPRPGSPLSPPARGGIPEVVRDGLTACSSGRPDDAAELAEKIIGLLGDAPLRQRLGQQGRELGCADFSWERIAGTLEAFYDEVMDINRHGQYLGTPKG